ncbi:Clr5 domain-containing protein [Xylariaceae sp. FL0594]|nr:Clr5 domain-containing protein [Xylariaceae sp. FL0594]
MEMTAATRAAAHEPTQSNEQPLVYLPGRTPFPIQPSIEVDADPSTLTSKEHDEGEHGAEHNRAHTQEEWDAIRPVIRKLYMIEDRSLKFVMQILEDDYNFYATVRMYKIRFRRWGWRKNRTRDHPRTVVLAGGKAKEIAPLRLNIQHVNAPELVSDQEVPICISRNYTIDQSGSQRWNCIVLNMSEPNQTLGGGDGGKPVVRFCDAETAYVNTIHQLRSGRIKDAFQSLNRLFDSMTGSRLYLHPKYLTGFWLLCHGIYNACAWVNDTNFRLLRELLCFHGENAATCFRRSSSSDSAHPIVSLMASVARMSRDNPGAMKQTFRVAYRAAAESLEEKLGACHPVVLVTWTDYFWYFNFPVDPAKDLVARHETALVETEAAYGRQADTTLCLLHNLTFFLFYCMADEALTREKLYDLQERTRWRIAAQKSPRASDFHVQRAQAFVALLQGIFLLQDHSDMVRCKAVIMKTIEWLKQLEGGDAVLHSKMLEMDLFVLSKAFAEGKDLRDLTLAFAKPRSADYDDAKPRRTRQWSQETSSSGGS